ncbi:MAG: membrane dipeptidase [Polyangiaceae bacterium]|nr:membrane dipeptidase [Polyangiaceae bacterium]
MQTELAWLLAQEARSAARKLRQGVGIPSEEDSPTAVVEEGSGGVESTLNRLDEAVSALASLHGNAMPRGRRGKVDIAALVWEVAPEASVQIEMGEGTTVFGDEAELRRMLQVLIGQSGPPTSSKGGPDISIRREGDNILVHVGLGSDLDGAFGNEQTPLDVDSIAALPRLPEILRARGYGEADIAGILSENFLRFLRRALA